MEDGSFTHRKSYSLKLLSASKPPRNTKESEELCSSAGVQGAGPHRHEVKLSGCWSCRVAWTTPTPCQQANVGTDCGACSWGTADACPPAPALPPSVAQY